MRLPKRTTPKPNAIPPGTCPRASNFAASAPALPCLPTENVNTPWTTWVSAEVTRQATVYVPVARRWGIVTAIVSATGCVTVPESTRLPAALYTASDGTLIPSS